ncbi:MAG TPA: hypothetical protein PKI14_14885 [Fervidobacterium sp.]|nr:hypothetical protein [Fervidobacterium sp.]
MDEKTYLWQAMLKEIDTIQSIIDRLASNSFHIKTWTVTTVIAALIFENSDTYRLFIAFIPLFIFWYLDAYFLRQERKYRQLYDWVIQHRLKTDYHMFDMNTRRFDCDVESLWRTMFSKTLMCFYGSIALLIAAYAVILTIQKGAY